MSADMLAAPQADSDFRPEDGELPYKPVPVLAMVALALGVCSLTYLLVLAAIPIAILGVVLGGAAFAQIQWSRGELGGRWMALTGAAASFLLLCSGTALHAYAYITEVPEGYERLDFYWLADQEPIIENGRLQLAPEAVALDGKQVFIKGYMYPQDRKTGLTQFVLCKDTGQCCFGGQPKLTDMVRVKFRPGITARHKEQQLVGVAGIFRAQPEILDGQIVRLYTLEGTHFK